MAFNTIEFIVFVSLVLVAFHVFHPKRRLHILTLASIGFYSYGNVFSALVLITIVLCTFLFSHYNKKNKDYSILAISFIVAILLFSKFALHDFESEFETELLTIAFPIGISFYSLQAIGYIIDVRDNKIEPETRPLRICLFLSFFSQSISGPIHRFNNLSKQFNTIEYAKLEYFSQGFKIALWGFFCKLIVADKISLVITPILDSPDIRDGSSLFIASILYSFQIYFDFYGYTLIAIGTAWMFGIRLSDNFNSPYRANSFKEFWKRWHITLSLWLRDYIYIRLGGRSNSYWKFGLAVIATFLVSSIWHGVTLNFIIWGTLHAFFYLIEDFARRSAQVKKAAQNILVKFIIHCSFFVLITFTWIIFRTADFVMLRITLKRIVTIGDWTLSGLGDYTNSIYLPFIILLIILQLVNGNKRAINISTTTPKTYACRFSEASYLIICLLLVFIFGDLGVQEFLYLNF